MGYVINKKKVYRLMKENNLLEERCGFKEKTYDECTGCYAEYPNKRVIALGRPSAAAGAYQFLYRY